MMTPVLLARRWTVTGSADGLGGRPAGRAPRRARACSQVSGFGRVRSSSRVWEPKNIKMASSMALPNSAAPITRAAPPRGPAAALPAPCSALVARSRGRAAIADRLPQIIQAYHSTHTRSSGEPCPPRLEIVKLAATASMAALAGRRTRSATPTIDPPTTPTDLGACEDDGEE